MIAVILCYDAGMANKQFKDLPAVTASGVVSTDIIPIQTDPSGTGVTSKISVAEVNKVIFTQPYEDIASATTTAIGATASQNVRITGTTTINSFGTAPAGTVRTGKFAGSLILTYNSVSLILPSLTSISTATNDTFSAVSLGSGNWIVTNYTKADGTALVGSGGAPKTATYITQTPDGTLTNEQALSALATGLVKNTTGTGVLSIGSAGTDYYAPGSTDVAIADGGTGASNAAAALDNLITAETTVASAATTDLGAQPSQNLQITGTTTITSFGTATAGKIRRVRLAASLTLTHNATSLILPSGANIVTAANDSFTTVSLGSGNWFVYNYTKADGTSLVTSAAPINATYITQTSNGTLTNEQALSSLGTGLVKNTTGTGVLSIGTAGTDYYAPGSTDVAVADGGTGASTAAAALDNLITSEVTVASAATTNLGAQASQNLQITGTTTITSFGTANAGIFRRVRLAASLTLTHNAVSLILPSGANIVTAANDSFMTVSLGSGNWFVYNYTKADGTALVNNAAPANATYITQTANGTLSNEQALSSLATGLLKNTNASGVLTIGTAGSDYYAPGSTDVAIADGGTGSSTVPGALDNLITPEVSIASASSTDIGSVASQNVNITGVTTITSFGVAAAGIRRWGRFSSSLTLTHNSASLILPGGANITTSTNDRFQALSLGSSNWLVYFYQKADGTSIVGGAGGTGDFSSNTTTSVDGEIVVFSGVGGKTGKRATGTGLAKITSGVLGVAAQGTDYYAPVGTDVAVADGGTGASTAGAALDNLITSEGAIASAATTNLGSVSTQNLQITGTTTITSFGTSAAGVRRWVRFSGTLTLTHNATSLILPGGSNITTAANDRLFTVSLGSGNWLVYFYQRADGSALNGAATQTSFFVLNIAALQGIQSRSTNVYAKVKDDGDGYTREYWWNDTTTTPDVTPADFDGTGGWMIGGL